MSEVRYQMSEIRLANPKSVTNRSALRSFVSLRLGEIPLHRNIHAKAQRRQVTQRKCQTPNSRPTSDISPLISALTASATLQTTLRCRADRKCREYLRGR